MELGPLKESPEWQAKEAEIYPTGHQVLALKGVGRKRHEKQI